MSSGRSKDRRLRSGPADREQPAPATGPLTREMLPSDSSIAVPEIRTSKYSEIPETAQFEHFQESRSTNHENPERDIFRDDNFEKLKYDLLQKDELITALVQELEQAVEQLDRLQRMGTSASKGTSSSQQPIQYTEHIDSQSSVSEEVRRLVDQLEQPEPGTALGRIESQLAAVFELVNDLHRGGQSFLDSAEEASDHTISASSQDETGATEHAKHESSVSNWESIKSEILKEASPAPTAESRHNESEFLKLLSETPSPQKLDFASAGMDQLKQAIDERDAYIIQLNRLFRSTTIFSVPTDWAILANVPAEMQLRVESLIEHLDVQVRLGEVEMSLERARLARERSQIQSEREHIEKHLRRLGIDSLAELDNISATTSSTGDRRWMRFLGPGKK